MRDRRALVDADSPLADCPLCGSRQVRGYAELGAISYGECDVCRLIFMDPRARLALGAERAHYDSHENDPADERYRAFLSRLATPLVRKLTPGAEGLDYGSGPGPTLSVILEEMGFDMTTYDPFFAPEEGALRRTYDFITCTETVEHFFRPGEEFERLDIMLRPGGWLAVMTETRREDVPFGDWRYARDPTHVSFYRAATMDWIAGHFGWHCELPHPNVVLFQKDDSTIGGAEGVGRANPRSPP